MAKRYIDIVNLDQDTLLALAENLKTNYPELNDWDFSNPNDPLRLTLESYLLAVEKLGGFANAISQNFTLASAISRDAIIEKAYMSGYVVTERTAASGQLKLNLITGTATVIDPFTLKVSGVGDSGQTVFYENTDSINLLAGDTSLDNVNFIEGESLSISKVAKGVKFETFFIQDNVIDGSIQLFVNGSEWQETLRMSGNTASSEVFVLKKVGEDLYQLTTGNGTVGAILPLGASIEIKYRKGSGSLGNLTSERITTIVNTPTERIVDILPTTGVTSFTGGQDLESNERIRTLAPKVPKLGDRIANTIDYDNYAGSYPGVGRAKSFNIGANSAICYVITEAGTPSPLLLSQLAKDANNRVIFNKFLTTEAANQIAPNISLEIVFSSNFIEQSVEDKVRSNITSFLNPFAKDAFGEFILEFGTDLLISDIIHLTKSIDGVVAAAILSPTPFSNQILIDIKDNEILTNIGSTIDITMVKFEESGISTGKTDKYLFTNPRNYDNE